MIGISRSTPYLLVAVSFFLLCHRAFGQPSLQPGIAQTKLALAHVEQLLTENQNGLANLYAGQGLDVLEKIGGVEAIGQFKNGYTLGEMEAALLSANYPQAIEKTASLIATVWGKSPTLDGQVVKWGQLAVEKSGDLYEAHSLVNQQSQLLNIWWQLNQQLATLQAKDPQNQAAWQRILQNLHSDSADMRAGYVRWLAAHNLERAAVAQSAIQSAMRRGTSAAIQVGSGMEDQDITDLSKIQGINPDFIAALRKERDLLRFPNMTNVEAASNIDRYPDGSYINIFGSPKLLSSAAKETAKPAVPSVDPQKQASYNDCVKRALSSWNPNSAYCVNACKPNSWGGPQACKQCSERPDTSYCNAWLK